MGYCVVRQNKEARQITEGMEGMEGTCDDCGCEGRLRELCACPNYHTVGKRCCFKRVCQTLCRYKCDGFDGCGKWYVVDPDGEGAIDWMYEATKCPYCDVIHNRKSRYWGDLREQCRRHCTCGVHKLVYPITVEGLFDDYPALAKKRNKHIYDELLAKALHPRRVSARLHAHMAEGGAIEDFDP